MSDDDAMIIRIMMKADTTSSSHLFAKTLATTRNDLKLRSIRSSEKVRSSRTNVEMWFELYVCVSVDSSQIQKQTRSRR